MKVLLLCILKLSCEVAMGDIQSEENRDIVLELELPPVASSDASEDVPLVKAELTYFNVATSQIDTMQCLVTTCRKGIMKMIQYLIVKINCHVTHYLSFCSPNIH